MDLRCGLFTVLQRLLRLDLAIDKNNQYSIDDVS